MTNAFQVLSEKDQQIYSTCLGLISGLGFVSNILFTVTIFARGMDSKFTTYMVRNQAVIDSLICFSTMMLVIFPNPLNSGVYVIDFIICRIWTSQALFWFLVLSGVYNLVFTAVDRYWAVLTPQNYKRHINRKLCVAYSIIVGMCGIIILPAYLQSKFDKGICTAEWQYNDDIMKNFYKGFSILWFLAIYGIPSLVMIYIYTKVILQLRNSMGGNTGANMKQAMKSFTNGALAATALFLMTVSYDAIYYMLGYLEVAPYIFNTPIQLVGVFLTAINSSVNPIIFFALVKTFRNTFVTIWCKCIVQRISKKIADTKTDSLSLA